jgi:predicted ATPase/DNA-binding SARP family transcriptional activator
MRIEFRILGPLELSVDDRVLPLGSPKQRALLALLLVHANETVSRDRLIAELWAEAPPASVESAFHVYLSRLRRLLESAGIGDLLARESHGYRLRVEPGQLDVSHFDKLVDEGSEALASGNPELAADRFREALTLWRGPALADLQFERFAVTASARLEEKRVSALEQRLEADLALGRHRQLIAELESLVAEHPYRERLRAQLMLVLYRSGRQADALRAYQEARRTLADELGLEPGAELRELQRRILRHDPTLALGIISADLALRLPAPPNRLLGRERELADLGRLLLDERVRLLVLTGAGGSGKTRLALEAAHQLADSFASGACLVELAPLRDPDLVLGAVARTLTLEIGPGADPLDSLAHALRPHELLLVLDNAEHLHQAAPLYTQLLAQAPRLSLLVTSRTVLHLSGERVYLVEPLAEPAAITLFNERAHEADPRFRRTSGDEQAIREICRRLDRLPLALELAAGRTRTLTPRELLDRLEPRLPLLTGGPRDLPGRQQTLRATLEWSYELLDEDEQRDLRRLAIFAGGSTLEAAEAVCDTTPERLATLVEHNLLQHHRTPAGSRYAMLETIREYAAQQLEHSGERKAVQRRHAEWCCALAERLPTQTGRISTRLRREEAVRLLREEYENIQGALAWTWAEGQDEIRLRLGSACFRMWTELGLFRDAVAWLEDAAARIPAAPPRVQLQALKVAGLIAFFVVADTKRADQYWAEALAAAEELGETDDITWIETWRIGAAGERGELERALVHWEEAVRRAHESGDGHAEAEALHLLGEVLRDLGRFDKAEQALLEADSICRAYRGSELFLAMNTHSLGDLALDRGDVAGALCRYRQSIEELRGRAPALLVGCLAGIASVLAERELDEDAATVWGAVCAAEQMLGFRMLGAERRRYESHLSRLENTPAWTAGKALTLEEATAVIAKS